MQDLSTGILAKKKRGLKNWTCDLSPAIYISIKEVTKTLELHRYDSSNTTVFSTLSRNILKTSQGHGESLAAESAPSWLFANDRGLRWMDSLAGVSLQKRRPTRSYQNYNSVEAAWHAAWLAGR